MSIFNSASSSDALVGRWRTKCGGQLVVEGDSVEHLVAHSNDFMHFRELVRRHVLLPRLSEELLRRTYDFGRVIGRTDCVPVERAELDTPVTFAFRNGRKNPSRVVIGAVGPETSCMSLVARWLRPGLYAVNTFWLGVLAPMEPHDKNLRCGSAEQAGAIEFWAAHALIQRPCYGEPFTSSWAAEIENACLRMRSRSNPLITPEPKEGDQ